jgi:hypothetical protein
MIGFNNLDLIVEEWVAEECLLDDMLWKLVIEELLVNELTDKLVTELLEELNDELELLRLLEEVGDETTGGHTGATGTIRDNTGQYNSGPARKLGLLCLL